MKTDNNCKFSNKRAVFYTGKKRVLPSCTFQRFFFFFYGMKIGLILAEIRSETWKITKSQEARGAFIGVGAFIEELIPL